MPNKQKITTFLWFDDNAEEAANYYVDVFKQDSKVVSRTLKTEGVPGPEVEVLVVTFQLRGQEFVALNGGPQFKFTEAISLVVNCDSQQEIDEFWAKLGAGGRESQCGWLKDRFGLSWQIAPTAFFEMVKDKDPAKVQRVMSAMMTMKKLDLPQLQRAYDGE